MSDRTIRPAPIRRSFTVRASRDRAFEVFTAGIGRWWPKSHTIGKSPLQRAVIEPFVGGRWYEVGEDGSESEWGRVLAFEPPGRLLLAWQIGADFRFDPAIVSEVEIGFVALGTNETKIDFEHRHLERLGPMAESLLTAFEGGWSSVLELFRHSADAPTENQA